MKPVSLLAYLPPALCFLARASAAWQVPTEYGISASPDGRFFQTSSGQPFFWQADTAWLLFHRLNYSEAETYLTDRADKGYSVVLAVGFTQIGIDSPNRAGDLPFVNDNVSAPNEPYWAHVDSVVQLAWSKGIRIALVPAWGSYVHSSTNEGSVLNMSTARIFGNFIGQRYPYLPKILVADTNPWWQNKTAVKADYTSGGVAPEYTHTDWGGVYDELAGGIVDGEHESAVDGSKRVNGTQSDLTSWEPLITIHPTNQWFSGGPVALASAFLGDRSWLTFDASQSGHADYPPNPPIPWWNCRRGWEPVELMYAAGEKEGTRNRRRPVLDNEPHYENRYNNGKSANAYWNASDIRVGSWQTVFSGAAGVTYGANNVMQMTIPGLYESDGSGPAASWEEDLQLSGSGQIQHIQKAVLDRGIDSYWTRVPARDIIVGDAGTDDQRITAMKDRAGAWIMVFSPTAKSFSIETGSLVGCDVTASWFDPVLGAYSVFDYSQCDGAATSTREFAPPEAVDHTDWMLLLESSGNI